jgi:hypothetical protein
MARLTTVSARHEGWRRLGTTALDPEANAVDLEPCVRLRSRSLETLPVSDDCDYIPRRERKLRS